MGYTHYIRNKPSFSESQWVDFCGDARKLFAKHEGILAGAHGVLGTSPTITSEAIRFNGIGEDSHETGCVRKGYADFEYCKTARKPYDKVVVAFYKLIRKYLPTTELSSDGGDEIFGGEKIIVNNKWTYLTGGYEVAVGDTVLLPSKFGGGDWEGKVTQMGSKYDGECKAILAVFRDIVYPKEGPLDHVDPNAQITTEEGIAAMLHDDYGLDEEDAADASRKALLIVAERLGFNRLVFCQ